MSKSTDKKAGLLGMPIGTASNRLRKAILFSLIVRLNENFCYQCEGEILSKDDMSIEHKEPWMQAKNPVDSFFDLKNISFSHLSCNSAAGTKPHQIYTTRREYKDSKNRLNRKWKKSMGKENRQKLRRDQYLRTGK